MNWFADRINTHVRTMLIPIKARARNKMAHSARIKTERTSNHVVIVVGRGLARPDSAHQSVARVYDYWILSPERRADCALDDLHTLMARVRLIKQASTHAHTR